jgi:hypothetical protein
MIPILSEKRIAWFWSKVEKGPGCWIWTGARKKYGYGQVGYKKADGKMTTTQAHRVSYALTYGDPGDLFVLHHCDNPPCVRPDHLFVGTHTDNMLDCAQKERRTHTKLTNKKVAEARKLAAKGENLYKIAESLEASPEQLVLAIRGGTWKHVEVAPVPDVDIYRERKVIKLSKQDVQDILEAVKNPYWGQVNDLARKYGVTHGLISQIKTGYYAAIST